MFQETAYCLAVEKLLGITDQIPERASTIRVLMMELTRISSHLVALATGGLELGATTVMTVGFRERERIMSIIEMITGLRMNNAYIRPGGVAQDLPRGVYDRIRDTMPDAAPRARRARGAAQREPHPQGPHRGRRLPRPHRVHRAGRHRPHPALRPGCRTTCARPTPTAATRPTTSRSSPATPATPTAACGSGSTRCTSRCGSSSRPRTGSRPTSRAAGHGRRQEDRLAGAAGHRRRRAWATASTTSARSWASRWSR